MSYVKGKYCCHCNVFVINGIQPHTCFQKDNVPVNPVHDTVKILPKKSMFTDLSSDEEIIQEPSKDLNIKVSKCNTNNNKSITEGVSKEDMHKLIACVETCRPIWNFKMSLSERSDTVKRNLWNQIFVNFDGKYSIESLQKSWKYLKEKYTREKKSEPSGAAGGKKNEWAHLKSLVFLDDVMTVNKNVTENLMSPQEETSTPMQKRSKKSTSTTFETHMGSLIEELKQNRPIPPPKDFFQEPEVTEMKFGSYLVSLMENFPKKKRIELEGKIITMVINELE